MPSALLRKLPKKELVIIILFFILVIQLNHDKEIIKTVAEKYYSVIVAQFINESYTSNAQNLHIGSFLTAELGTLHLSAGLGNQMYEIASLYGIASRLQMKPFIQQILLRQIQALQTHYPSFSPLLLNNISTEVVSFTSKCCSYVDVEKLRNYTNQNVTMNGWYFQSYRFFDEIRPQIKEMFTFSPATLTAAQLIMNNVREEFHSRKKSQSSIQTVLYVCVHIRRGDFVTDPQLLESRTEFTVDAINWLRTELKGKGSEVLFLLLGNDRDWAERLFSNDSNIFVPSSPAERTVDMALMAISCDVILLSASASTFGFWGAYLSDKAIVYYNQDYAKDKNGWYYNQFTPSDVFLSKWTPLKFNSSSISTTTTTTAITATSSTTRDTITSSTTATPIPTTTSPTPTSTTSSTFSTILSTAEVLTTSLAASNNGTTSTTTPTQPLTSLITTSTYTTASPTPTSTTSSIFSRTLSTAELLAAYNNGTTNTTTPTQSLTSITTASTYTTTTSPTNTTEV